MTDIVPDTDLSEFSLMKEMRTAALCIIAMWVIVYGILSLSGCNCYVTLVHTQGHATDVVDDSAQATLPIRAV